MRTQVEGIRAYNPAGRLGLRVLLETQLARIPVPILSPRSGMMFAVIAEMAPLAHRLEIRRIAVLGRVIQVRNCQNHAAPRPFRRMPVNLFASARAARCPMEPAFACTLALAARALANLHRNLFPVLRIAKAVFWTDRAHAAFTFRQRHGSNQHARQRPELSG